MEADPLATWGYRVGGCGAWNYVFSMKYIIWGGGKMYHFALPFSMEAGRIVFKYDKNKEYDIFQFFMHYLELYWDKIIKLRN